MSHDIIQVNYEILEQVAQQFAEAAQGIEEMLQEVRGGVENLQDEWVGFGSDAFFSEMGDEVLPAVARLRDGLHESSRVTINISQTIHEAEKKGAALFQGEASALMPNERGSDDSVQSDSQPSLSNFAFPGGVAWQGFNDDLPMPDPPPPPPQPPGDGSGPHGAAGEPTAEDWSVYQRMRQAAAFAYARGLSVASQRMNHFLDNTGETYYGVYVDKMLSDITFFGPRTETQYRREILRPITQQIKSTYDGKPMQFQVTTGWAGLDSDEIVHSDWFYGMGGFRFSQTAVVTITPDPETGLAVVAIDSQVHVFDRYNWDSDKHVRIPFSEELASWLPDRVKEWIDDHTIAGDFILDTQMGRLHQVGIAQEYEMQGQSTTQSALYVYDPVAQTLRSLADLRDDT